MVDNMANKSTPNWLNPEIFEIGRRPMTSSASHFLNKEQALENDLSSTYLDLNGSWKFHFTPSIGEEPDSFYKLEHDDSGWDEIDVPGVWQLQGYGNPHYRNIGLPHGIDEKHPPNIDPSQNSLGRYRKQFTLPEDWHGKSVILHFGAVQAAFQVWINGEEVGYSQDSRLPAEFDITEFLVPGENLISALVFRFSDGSYLEDQDMWFLNGIFRNVYIYSLPPIWIDDFFLRCDFDPAYQNAKFLADITLKSTTAVDQKLTLIVELIDPSGNQVIVE